MSNWIDLKKKQFLTIEDMAAINNNFEYLRNYFISIGLSVQTLKNVVVSYNTSPADIQQKFNDVEHNIQVIHQISYENLEIKNPYFKNHFWTAEPSNIKTEVYRWIDWFNKIKDCIIALQKPTVSIVDGTLKLSSKFAPPNVQIKNNTLILTETIANTNVEIKSGTLILK